MKPRRYIHDNWIEFLKGFKPLVKQITKEENAVRVDIISTLMRSTNELNEIFKYVLITTSVFPRASFCPTVRK